MKKTIIISTVIGVLCFILGMSAGWHGHKSQSRAVYKLAILKGCLNPYCSGQWSRTHLVLRYSLMRRVLILIVVDDGLVLRQVAMGAAAIQAVLILIVMDDGLVRKEKSITDGEHVS